MWGVYHFAEEPVARAPSYSSKVSIEYSPTTVGPGRALTMIEITIPLMEGSNIVLRPEVQSTVRNLRTAEALIGAIVYVVGIQIEHATIMNPGPWRLVRGIDAASWITAQFGNPITNKVETIRVPAGDAQDDQQASANGQQFLKSLAGQLKSETAPVALDEANRPLVEAVLKTQLLDFREHFHRHVSAH